MVENLTKCYLTDQELQTQTSGEESIGPRGKKFQASVSDQRKDLASQLEWTEMIFLLSAGHIGLGWENQ